MNNVLTLNWYQKPYEYLTRDQYNKMLDELRADPDLEEIPKTDIRRYAAFSNTFQVIPIGNSAAEIRVRKDYGHGQESHRYKYQNSQQTVEEQNTGITGGAAYDILDNMFISRHGISIFKAFTGKEYKDLYKKLKSCVPPQIHYAVPTFEPLDHGYKADVSSCFPAELSRILPTMHGSKLVHGHVKPNEQYPFAFYLNSHHLAIYKEFDTHELNNRWYQDYYRRTYIQLLDEEEEETLLCPASEYSFEPIMRRLYNGRKEHAENKEVMNKTIGVFHYNGNPRLAHLAAVVIARSIYHMCVRANWLEAESNKVYHIATDAILWQGQLSPCVCTGAKDMGRFMLEEQNIRFCVRSANCYQFEREDGTVVTKFSGNVPKAERDAMQLGDVWSYSDDRLEIKKIQRTEDGHFQEVLTDE